VYWRSLQVFLCLLGKEDHVDHGLKCTLAEGI
jgi:hypothetical protein